MKKKRKAERRNPFGAFLMFGNCRKLKVLDMCPFLFSFFLFFFFSFFLFFFFFFFLFSFFFLQAAPFVINACKRKIFRLVIVVWFLESKDMPSLVPIWTKKKPSRPFRFSITHQKSERKKKKTCQRDFFFFFIFFSECQKIKRTYFEHKPPPTQHKSLCFSFFFFTKVQTQKVRNQKSRPPI